MYSNIYKAKANMRILNQLHAFRLSTHLYNTLHLDILAVKIKKAVHGYATLT